MDFTDSGAFNPCDRLETIIVTSLDLGNPPETATAPLLALCQRFNITPLFVPPDSFNLIDSSRQLSKITTEFGHFLTTASSTMAGGRITAEDRRKIEVEAQHLLSALTLFVGTVNREAR